MSKIIGIYKITSPSGKIYIGQSRNVCSREKSYERGNGYKFQIKLENSIKKYGVEEHIFEVVEECEFEDLNKRERYWQDFYDVLGPNGLNCILQETDELPRITSKNTKNKMSFSRLGSKNPMFGKTHSSEARLKISKALKGVLSGENHPAFGTKHSRNKKGKFSVNYGKKRSEKSKNKMSISQKGKIVDKKGRENISLSKMGDSNPNSKIVLDISIGVFYTSLKEASLYYNYSYDYLQRMLRGQYKNNSNLIYC